MHIFRDTESSGAHTKLGGGKFSDFSVEMQYGLKSLQAIVYLSSPGYIHSGPC